MTDERHDAPAAARLPEATVRRLPVYLRALVDLAASGTRTTSSDGLAHAAGLNSAKVRKDLSYLGSYGTRGVGYEVDGLVDMISSVLGLTRDWCVVLVGTGNLGRALVSYGGFATRGFRIVGVVDADPDKIGQRVADHTIVGLDALPEVVEREGASIGVIATPADAAQEVANRLVSAGVTSILNFAPAHLEVPADVHVRKVDLSTELQILTYYEQ